MVLDNSEGYTRIVEKSYVNFTVKLLNWIQKQKYICLLLKTWDSYFSRPVKKAMALQWES